MTTTQRTLLPRHPRTRPLLKLATGLGVTTLVIGGLATSATSAAGASQPAPLRGASAAGAIAGEYLVVLKDGAGSTPKSSAQVKAAAARSTKLGAKVGRRYTHVIQGYSATLSAAELAKVRKDPAVAYVQQNLTVKVAGSTQKPILKAAGAQKNPISWGQDRVDQRNLPLDKNYYYSASGDGVTVYVVDSGLATGNPDLPNVGTGVDYVGDGNGTNDCDGHGTHVSGTIAGEEFGLAKDATIVPMRVLNCNGEGDTDGLLAALDAVQAASASGPKVANLSLGYDGVVPVVDDALKALVAGGVTVVVAAGNGDANNVGQSACSYSPSDVRSAITVGATTTKDARASYSNFGKCVDLYAPGTDIASDWIPDANGNQQYAIISGTSMATPHVTGAAAMYLQRHPTATPADVSAALTSTATANKVTNVSSSWPRLLLFALQKAVTPKGVTSGNRLNSGESLVHTSKLTSSNGKYVLTHASGKLRLQTSAGKVIWSAGSSASFTTLSSGGALHTYDAYGRLVWSSKSNGGVSTLFVNSNGYLVIQRNSDKKTLWTSKG